MVDNKDILFEIKTLVVIPLWADVCPVCGLEDKVLIYKSSGGMYQFECIGCHNWRPIETLAPLEPKQFRDYWKEIIENMSVTFPDVSEN